LQNEVDFRASHSGQAVEAHSRIISVPFVVTCAGHVSGNGLVALESESDERHRVPVLHIVR